MSAVAEAPLPIQMTDAAANKVKTLITEEENPELKLRVYITGGAAPVSSTVSRLTRKSMMAIPWSRRAASPW